MVAFGLASREIRVMDLRRDLAAWRRFQRLWSATATSNLTARIEYSTPGTGILAATAAEGVHGAIDGSRAGAAGAGVGRAGGRWVGVRRRAQGELFTPYRG